ncbi:hypothetical protein FXV77_01810 [Sphingobacterium phlebotomi]|uniref:DUF5703 domain-containing protein n=1 Tax=Sphingobacterium phlebotomi TaxID=2605433 RepID=A0A5D4HD25_9SPHI|nr:DUF5703 domain-containing protein [Sphingobacterium phlebotomi]TYR38043.1 hypothetical protein FXV77_01810 [Sphingobacterium phlebotomi]
MNQLRYIVILICCILLAAKVHAQEFKWEDYYITWDKPSKHSGESMPLGGGDIGLNVWVENGDILFYLGKSGAFDENNTLLKLGRVRLKLYPNPFEGKVFKQQLQVDKGQVVISGESNSAKAEVTLWVDVERPNVYVDVHANKKIDVEASYENWRHKERYPKKRENNANSWKWAPPHEVVTKRDSVNAVDNKVVFFHQNTDSTVFDIVVRQQGMEAVKDSLYNPLADLVSGGMLQGKDFHFIEQRSGKYMDTDYNAWVLKSKKPVTKHDLQVSLHVAGPVSIAEWRQGVDVLSNPSESKAHIKRKNLNWWRAFWKRSYIRIQPTKPHAENESWQVGRNYQLFRFMLAANAYGEYPTKFNGGLFTYDPSSIDSTMNFTPDFRNWGGGTHTAQNQRLVYWPMLKSGDFDMMPAQFKFYQRIQRNAEWRSNIYWGHSGASFTEQIENFGLPNPAEYNWKRPKDYDKGLEYNAWLEYQWDTVLEFCMMMLETANYHDADVRPYIPFIESCLRFFDEHYQYRARQLGSKILDQNGHLIFYPGSSAETYKMAYNASTTVAALQEVTRRMLSLSAAVVNDSLRTYMEEFQRKIPPLPTRVLNGKKMLAPAEIWARINNTEAPQLYGVYPWGIYGIGKPDIDIALNTFHHDPDVLKFRSHVGWKQDNIFAARLGLTEEAKKFTTLKLKNADRRFPTFWGPGFDWVPDHNWGGSGMIGLQEMLLQTADDKLYLFPAWPAEWDVDFKLHAPKQTTVEGKLRNGKLIDLQVLPKERTKDVVNMLE